MISTGSGGIDDMLGGGIPKGSRVLFSMEPGVDGQLLMISTLISAIAKGHSCLVVIPHTTVDAFQHDAAGKRGCTINIFKKNVVFVDSVDRERIAKRSTGSKAAQAAWEAKIRKLSAENAVDIVFVYLDLLYEDLGLAGALSIAQSAKISPDTTVIIEHLNLEGKGLIQKLTTPLPFDLIITISSSSRYIPHFDYFTLQHISWSALPKRSVPFITAEGKIVPYIPKIVVTGPACAGKSTFVTNASDLGFSVDRRGLDGEPTTVAMDFGWLKWKGFDITLYGTPGQERFDPIVPMLLPHAMGAILIIDATRPETLERALHHLRLIEQQHLPMVIAANKSDLPGVASERENRKHLGINTTVPVFFISATRRADVQRVIESLVDDITKVPL